MKLPPLPKQRQRRRLIAVGVAAFLIIWAGLAVRSVTNGRSSALEGLDRLEALRDEFEIEQLDSGQLTAELSAAANEFADAQSNLRAPWVAPFRVVPWVGTQIRSADALSNSAAITADALAKATDTVLDIKQGTSADLINKADASSRLLQLTTDTRVELADLELGPSSGLLGSLADARIRFEDELEDLDATLGEAETAMVGLSEFLTGPTTYLLLSANPSEMRAGSGRFLIAGPVYIENGEITVGELISPEDALLPPGAVLIEDPDLAEHWSWLEPTTDLRNLGSTPRFDANAQLAAAMWEEYSGQAVDGVLALDPVALEAVLGTDTTVIVDGLELDGFAVLSHILFEQYWERDIETRRERQRAIAEAALSEALGQDRDLIELATSLRDTAAGRHVLAWSSNPAQQDAWRTLGIDGALQADSLMISVQNEGFNKLDTFLEITAVGASWTEGVSTNVEIVIEVANSATAELPQYVLGPGNQLGSYEGIVIVNAPGQVTGFTLEGPGDIVAGGADGPTQMLARTTEIEAGATASYIVRFTLPEQPATLAIEPAARVPGIGWSFNDVSWTDVARRSLNLTTADYGPSPATAYLDVSGLGVTPPIVPPSPALRLSDDAVSLEISWRLTPDDVSVVVWERLGSDDWEVLEAAGPAIGSVTRLLDSAVDQYCSRISLSLDATTFSSTSCLHDQDS